MDKNDKNGLVDFHFHSAHSDGSEGIAVIIEEAKRRNIVAMALTDHNNGNGVQEFVAACREAGIYAIEGTEIYASFADQPWSWDCDRCGPVPDVMILGKKLNWGEFREYQEMLVQYWLNYWMPASLDSLRSAGLEVPSLSRDGIWDQLKDFGVPHVFNDVVNDPRNHKRLFEICHSFNPFIMMNQVVEKPRTFANKYLYAIGKQGYVLRAPTDWTVKKAVELAESMGGVLFVAHPGGDYANWTDKHLDYFVAQGGRGIETHQYFHSKAQIAKFEAYAKEHNLLVSGGSDWHGKNGRPTLGLWDKPSNQVPFKVFEQLLDRLP